MSEETKIKLFQTLLEMEHLAEKGTFDNRNYAEQSDGAFQMLEILGLADEYIWWSYGK